MRLAVRRAVGVAGATAVAIGAALVLALPASAHTPNINATCNTDTGKAVLSVDLESYTANSSNPNRVSVSIDGKDALSNPSSPQDFQTSFTQSWIKDGSVTHTLVVTIYAQDDPQGKNHGPGSTHGVWDGTFTKDSKACCPPKTTTTTPPTTTTTTAPPTTTTKTTPPTTGTTTTPKTTTGTTTATTTTTTAVVAATSTTPGTGTLPFTGVNAGFPLAIAGILVLAGGGLLFWLRFNARRRNAG